MKSTVLFLSMLLLCVPLSASAQPVASPPHQNPQAEAALEKTLKPEKEFSRAECRWATRWINKEIAFLMGNDTIDKIIAKVKIFEVHMGPPWDELEFSRRGEILKNLSRAREITGHSPFFSVRQQQSNDIIAVVSEWAIRIMVPGEGYFEYLFENEDKENTFY